jgi:aerobic-type carbon monoxide dehydrogenase small subunit (CoxS/CutS family)
MQQFMATVIYSSTMAEPVATTTGLATALQHSMLIEQANFCGYGTSGVL